MKTLDGYAVGCSDLGLDDRVHPGQVMASLRAVDRARSLTAPNGDYTYPYLTTTVDTQQPVVPGEQTVIDVPMTATDAVLAPGHRLRVTVYAADFPLAVPLRPLLDASGLKTQYLQLDPDNPSYLNLPSDIAIG
ncbi:CocE/NonD family hydrolase C-terminal non-catalytic domain-containing protein [Nocardia brasiliensis]|uniref:CocE/NonD family hydrolase C-terminal non-catalytic domain-containing protein n=1 Tax=Nocardia brasiliensis TaxID=37326 RepID=UPI002457E3F3|nr:CocE/NonD family hydrolase C-terminal non-catalytic domain-containing protein [Nocardia brasiliensis]